jgi:hypothetical protein
MSRRLQRMKKEIERRGGFIHLRADVPDDIAEAFLREVLECPDCLAAAGKTVGLDPRERGTEH